MTESGQNRSLAEWLNCSNDRPLLARQLTPMYMDVHLLPSFQSWILSYVEITAIHPDFVKPVAAFPNGIRQVTSDH